MNEGFDGQPEQETGQQFRFCNERVVCRDGQDTLRNILLQDTVIGKIKYLFTRYCYS